LGKKISFFIFLPPFFALFFPFGCGLATFGLKTTLGYSHRSGFPAPIPINPLEYHSLSHAVALGSAVFSTAVFGVSPKTSVFCEHAPNGDSSAYG
jgi:hypothetical protein